MPYFNDSSLFIISSDFSHYPSYNDAEVSDKIIATSIITGNPEKFLLAYRSQESSDVPGLVTPICSWTAVLTFMYMTEGRNDVEYIPLMYKNSGDAEIYGDKSRVVGYYSIALSQKVIKEITDNEDFSLSSTAREMLIGIARNSINEYVKYHRTADMDESELSENLKRFAGAFVTLTIKGRLRGCIGRFDPQMPLYKVVSEMAVSAAVNDTRFSEVKASELNEIEIEISVLTPLRHISSKDEIMLGRDGIYIIKGHRSGTLLPQVATSHPDWTVDDFLGYCARDKAGLGWNGWKDADIYTYQALIFHEQK